MVYSGYTRVSSATRSSAKCSYEVAAGSVPGMHLPIPRRAAASRTFGLAEKEGHVRAAALSTGIANSTDAGRGSEGSLLLASPSGSGKAIGMQFIVRASSGEPGIVAVFEEIPTEHVQRAAIFSIDFDTPQKEGMLKLIYLRPLDLSIDETV
jgi:circadian clock protein KaiC